MDTSLFIWGGNEFVRRWQSEQLDDAYNVRHDTAWDRSLLSLIFCFEKGILRILESLAVNRAREVPPIIQHSAALAWRRRWTRMLSVVCARSFACSLVALPKVPHVLAGADGPPPDRQICLRRSVLLSVDWQRDCFSSSTQKKKNTHTHSEQSTRQMTNR